MRVRTCALWSWVARAYLPKYRDKKTVELLWKGITQYLVHYNLDVMFGCASFENTNPEELALPLSYLYQNHLTPDAWHVTARDELFVEMNRIAKEDINNRQALRELPPMIRGYVRAGCFIGDGAVVDEQFGTTDVLILFPHRRNERSLSLKIRRLTLLGCDPNKSPLFLQREGFSCSGRRACLFHRNGNLV